ncbi:endonuclease/exonuclease/phosphatase family protein [bacterium]|nr:endonuclease/exonuclease/phosphatase family protein [bacterium]
MKLIFYVFFILTFLFLSCENEEEKDPCKHVNCGFWQVCEEGVCVLGENFCDSTSQCTGIDECSEHICITPELPNYITIATFNVHDFSNPEAYNIIGKWIKDRKIDVISFMEIQKEDATPLDEALLNNSANGYSNYFTSYGGYGGDESDFIALWSRYSVKSSETIITGTYKDPISGRSYSMTSLRPILKTVIEIDSVEYTFYALHLKAQSPYPDCDTCVERRRAQANALKDYILSNQQPEIDNIVILGDVNSAMDIDFTTGNTMEILSLKTDENPDNDFVAINYRYLPEDAWTHNSYQNRLDHIFLSPTLHQRYIENSISIDSFNVEPSDHKPVLLQISK